MPSQRIPRGQAGAGRFAPVVTSVAALPELVSRGLVTPAYARRIGRLAPTTELTPETRRAARGHVPSIERAARAAAREELRDARVSHAPAAFERGIARELERDERFRRLWEDATIPIKGVADRPLYTPSDSEFGRVRYHSRGYMARFLRMAMHYTDEQIDYILYPDDAE